MNELSNKIDLPSTLLRAQTLFRRFQRTVEAIDKKDNFPTPPIRRRTKDADTNKSSANPRPKSSDGGPSTTTGADVRNGSGHIRGSSNPIENMVSSSEAVKKQVISSELRALLSRKVEKLDKNEVVEHGGGIGTSAQRTVRDV